MNTVLQRRPLLVGIGAAGPPCSDIQSCDRPTPTCIGSRSARQRRRPSDWPRDHRHLHSHECAGRSRRHLPSAGPSQPSERGRFADGAVARHVCTIDLHDSRSATRADRPESPRARGPSQSGSPGHRGQPARWPARSVALCYRQPTKRRVARRARPDCWPSEPAARVVQVANQPGAERAALSCDSGAAECGVREGWSGPCAAPVSTEHIHRLGVRMTANSRAEAHDHLRLLRSY